MFSKVWGNIRIGVVNRIDSDALEQSFLVQPAAKRIGGFLDIPVWFDLYGYTTTKGA